ncbi:phosphodiesterase, MJ0936 family protein [Trichomonas vaginalis G3]|uniref:Vacuolar protein sorting-associated protein 29 n=1 Tax=Trichomonas vaginalis (strain ATCC PRA-98 / G3) TaxID=412133 RepID=A2ELH2_TRIV3|nr:retrograde transport, endosome to Golgi [Trichomonas vaginalis G3]EAY06499.1 phosphodiesterase, MJ0936 family protein [Trichomonas vaginalis G3]KAI5538866.1 retrograde transport, endosome to Golgi [Trichomonas vaginalis G3]|eukprot:XP_001318722.1 phosphodiesterase, MJ0936 family protein [Trichomonas vaginalis G3]
MLILVIGDLHIPQRKLKIPEQFLKLIVPGKLDKVICVGNLTTPDQMAWIKSLCKDVTVVYGDYDEKMTDVSERATLSAGSFKIGVIHGHQVLPWGDPERLGAVGREMNVDILVSGQTHVASVSTYENILFLNPGSLTGAYSNTATTSTPSFMVLDVKKDQMTVYLYQIGQSDDVEVLSYNHTLI